MDHLDKKVFTGWPDVHLFPMGCAEADFLKVLDKNQFLLCMLLTTITLLGTQ